MVYHVATTDGRTTSHIYSFPFREAAPAILTRIVNALAGDAETLMLSNPLVAYNAAHIVSVGFERRTPEEMTRQVRPPMGFRSQVD